MSEQDYATSQLSEENRKFLSDAKMNYSGKLTDFKKKLKKYKRIRFTTSLILFGISAGGITSAITVTPLLSLITFGGVLIERALEQIKLVKKITILKNLCSQLRAMLDRIDYYLRNNHFHHEKFAQELFALDTSISEAVKSL